MNISYSFFEIKNSARENMLKMFLKITLDHVDDEPLVFEMNGKM